LCLLGAIAVELIILFYTLEREAVSRWVGWALVGLRLTLLVLTIGMLLQIEFHSIWNKDNKRFIAVLVDDSASMHLADGRLTPTEKLRLARFFEVEKAENPLGLSDAAEQLDELRGKIEEQLAGLETIRGAEPEVVARQIDRRRGDLVALFDQIAAATTEQSEKISTALAQEGLANDPLQAELAKAQAGLEALANEQVPSIRDGIGQQGAGNNLLEFTELVSQFRAVRDTFEELRGQMAILPARLDDAHFASLSPEERQKIEAVCESMRSVIASRVLLQAKPGEKNLLARIGENHVVKLYHFASEAKQAQPESIESAARDVIWPGARVSEKKADATDEQAALQRRLAAQRSATDFAAALARVKKEVPADRLSGIVVLTDGRHNVTDADWIARARELTSKESPIHTIVIGGETPPKDIAIVDVKRPRTVFTGDKIAMKAQVKADGYRGRELVVRLLHGEEEVDTRTIKVASDRYREEVDFSHRPEGAGMHAYHVEILDKNPQPGEDELIAANNRSHERIAVSDDRTKLLLIEDRPRWEYRFLKNLFTGRDRSVMLQHVLLHPDRIEGLPPAPTVHASASRPFGEFAATALPEGKKEWMKYDCIVLGDLPPSALDDETLDILADYVQKRGGSLIVIAGSFYMPHAYADTRLADILPVEIDEIDGAALYGPEPVYRLALTGDGRTEVITRQGDTADETEDVWNTMAPLFWRHPGTVAKKSARVLAYAQPLSGEEDSDDAELSEQQKRQTERKRALIVCDQVGAGRVLMLNFDRVWRRRLFTGNRYHYRFWAQALRWATTDKLPVGTMLVRLGTDRSEYGAGDPITVKARLVDEKGDEVQSDKVTAAVYFEDRLITTKRMNYVPDSVGRYEATLGSMPFSGAFRIELTGKLVQALLENESTEKVSTEVVVGDAERTSELFELAASREIPLRLASLSQGGIKGAVFYPEDADDVTQRFGPPTKPYTESQDYSLWDSWWLLVLCVVVVSSEWTLRKKVGLV